MPFHNRKTRRHPDDAAPELEFLEDMTSTDDAAETTGLGRKIALVVCVITAAVAVFLIARTSYAYRQARTTYDTARHTAVQVMDDPAVVSPLQSGVVKGSLRPEGATLEIDFDVLRATNEEIVAWLHVPAIDVSYPVAQTTDNEFYLDHTWDKSKNANGAIFMERSNLPDFSHGNTFLYGHNSVDGSMFGRLHEFSSNDALWNAEPYFYIYRADGAIMKYRIYSYYTAQTGSRSYVWFADDASYDYYVGLTLGLSDRELDADFSTRGPIVTLSTCYGQSGTTSRYLVHGVLTDEGKAE